MTIGPPYLELLIGTYGNGETKKSFRRIFSDLQTHGLVFVTMSSRSPEPRLFTIDVHEDL